MEPGEEKEIIERLVEILFDIAPDAATLSMYGGTMVELIAGDPKSRKCGYFAYANHVSLEFTNGARFDDQHGVLEGRGKLRRHMKLRKVRDVETKHCAEYLRQAVKI